VVEEEGSRPRTGTDSDTGSIVAGTSHCKPKTRALAVFGRCSTSESCSIDRGTPLSSFFLLGFNDKVASTIPSHTFTLELLPAADVCCSLLPPSATRPAPERGGRGTRHDGGLAGAAECTRAMSQASSRGSSRVSCLILEHPSSILHTANGPDHAAPVEV